MNDKKEVIDLKGKNRKKINDALGEISKKINKLLETNKIENN